MQKIDLIKKMSCETGISNEITAEVLENFMLTVKTHVGAGESLFLRGFGTFETVKRNLKHFHAAPGKMIIIPEHYEVSLKFSNEVKEMIK